MQEEWENGKKQRRGGGGGEQNEMQENLFKSFSLLQK